MCDFDQQDFVFLQKNKLQIRLERHIIGTLEFIFSFSIFAKSDFCALPYCTFNHTITHRYQPVNAHKQPPSLGFPQKKFINCGKNHTHQLHNRFHDCFLFQREESTCARHERKTPARFSCCCNKSL